MAEVVDVARQLDVNTRDRGGFEMAPRGFEPSAHARKTYIFSGQFWPFRAENSRKCSLKGTLAKAPPLNADTVTNDTLLCVHNLSAEHNDRERHVTAAIGHRSRMPRTWSGG